MSESKKNVPKIRFPGFTDAWEQRAISDLADRYDSLRVPITASDRIAGSTPYYGANGIQDYVDGFTHDGEFILIAEDGASDLHNYPVQYVNGKVWVNNHAHVLQAKQNMTDNKFLMNAIRHTNMEPYLVGGGRAKLNADVMMKIIVSVPELAEQVKIGEFFDTLDHLISLHQSKLNNVQNLKAGLLQKMFPKDGEEFPEVRFPGFTDAWEQRRLVDNVEEVLDYRGKSPTKFGMQWGDEGYLVLSALNVKDGYIDKSVEAKYGDQELFEKWMGDRRLEKGDVLFTTEAPLGNVAQVPDNEGYILNQRAVAFKTDGSKTSNDFLAQLLRSPVVQARLNANASGGTAKGIGIKEFAKLTTYVPIQVEEHNKIGTFLSNLDHLITLYQRKLEHLQQQKKSLLQQMFV